jgi:hypothetical protein
VVSKFPEIPGVSAALASPRAPIPDGTREPRRGGTAGSELRQVLATHLAVVIAVEARHVRGHELQQPLLLETWPVGLKKFLGVLDLAGS